MRQKPRRPSRVFDGNGDGERFGVDWRALVAAAALVAAVRVRTRLPLEGMHGRGGCFC